METGFENIVIARAREPKSWWQSGQAAGVIGLVVLLCGTLLGAVATAKGWMPFAGAKAADENKVPIYLSSDQNVNRQLTLNGGFSAVAKAVTPAVVTINVSSRQRQTPSLDPFREFFGDPNRPNRPFILPLPDQDQDEDGGQPRRRNQTPQPQPRGRLQPSGVGSGVLVSPDGYIITNNHVVEGADKVEVSLNDRRQFAAKVIGTDPPSDLAVIKIEGTGFPTLTFGDSEKIEIGDLVLAVGNPLGIGQTVTMGIISATGRSTGRGDNSTYENFIQTDAAINRGNSGGALVNLNGELIGVPSQILSGTGGNIGIGFAIPTSQARSVMDQILRGGKVRRGKLGVTVTGVTPEYADQFNYKGTQGALVQDLVKGDPAEQAGVQAGDIITEFQGQRIQDSAHLRTLASQTAPGTPVKFKVWREGKELELSAKLAEVDIAALKSAETEKPASGTGSSATGLLSGVRVDTLTPERAKQMNLPETARGVVVIEIEPESNAAAVGLRRGMVIEEVGRQPVTNVNEFNSAMQRLGERKSVLLRVRDGSGARFIIVSAQE